MCIKFEYVSKPVYLVVTEKEKKWIWEGGEMKGRIDR